jgi:hypothetical protein
LVRLHSSTPSTACCLCDGYKCSHEHQYSSHSCSSPNPWQPCIGSSAWQT